MAGLARAPLRWRNRPTTKLCRRPSDYLEKTRSLPTKSKFQRSASGSTAPRSEATKIVAVMSEPTDPLRGDPGIFDHLGLNYAQMDSQENLWPVTPMYSKSAKLSVGLR